MCYGCCWADVMLAVLYLCVTVVAWITQSCGSFREEILLATALYDPPVDYKTRTSFDLMRVVEDQVRDVLYYSRSFHHHHRHHHR